MCVCVCVCVCVCARARSRAYLCVVHVPMTLCMHARLCVRHVCVCVCAFVCSVCVNSDCV